MAWMVLDYPEQRYRAESPPICPVCGGECEYVYRDMYFAVVGCDGCVTVHEADETEDCLWRGV